MKTAQLIAVLTLAVAGGAAMADDITIAHDHFVSTTTRAEVRSEVLQAQADGTLRIPEVGAREAAPTNSALTRAEVRAELKNVPKMAPMVYNPAA